MIDVDLINEMAASIDPEKVKICICESCKFSATNHLGYRFCQRYAPKPLVISCKNDDEYYYANWPIVNDLDFCGEFIYIYD